MGIPVYALVGYSGTGKTTFLEKLIGCLKERGVRLAVIKHDAHDFTIDHPGKDSWRFSRAGADLVAVASADKTAFVYQRGLALGQIIAAIRDVDLILCEGYKHEDIPRIALYRSASGNPLAGEAADFIALVTDTPFEAMAPQFALDDAQGVADLIMKRMEAGN